MIELLWLPFLACLVLAGVHVYLGLHVLARGVIFVDLALAQVAALGITTAFLAGHPLHSQAAYWYALAFTLAGAGLLAASRTRHGSVPQEAIIGIVYAVSAAVAIVIVDRAPQGTEHIKQLLVGSILTVTREDVLALATLYAGVGALHWIIRGPMLEISLDPEGALARGRWVRTWDVVFYTTFGLVVTSSVRIAGVLLVFSYLIVPATVAALLARAVRTRLLIGWAVGGLVSVVGLVASYVGDLPTGATVVTTFGAVLLVIALGRGLATLACNVGARGTAALRTLGVAVAVAAAVAGLLLVLFPGMDHPWLDALEHATPAVQLGFLTPFERRTWRDAREAVRRDAAEIERLRRLERDVQWGTRPMDETGRERLRQFLAGRSEIAAGDRMVIQALRHRARTRQRYWVGVPLVVAGALAAFVLARRRTLAAAPTSVARRT
jgi:zinc/manganese transport system permease protein